MKKLNVSLFVLLLAIGIIYVKQSAAYDTVELVKPANPSECIPTIF